MNLRGEVNFQEFDKCWFALQVRSRYERVTSAILRDKGYEEFVPMSWVTREWSDRRKKIEIPLFPGYVFCRFDISVLAPILSTVGAIRLLGNGKEAISISNEEIENIQAVMRSGQLATAHTYLKLGQRVRINEGPLSGIEGILINVQNNRRLVLSIDLIQSSIAVEVGDTAVSPVIDTKPAPSHYSNQTIMRNADSVFA